MPARIKNKIHVSIGARIKQLRLNSNISQAELSDLLNTSGQEVISRMESGVRPPTVEELIMLQGVFRVTLDYLVMGKESGQRKKGS